MAELFQRSKSTISRRIWATRMLREYLVKGFAMNDELLIRQIQQSCTVWVVSCGNTFHGEVWKGSQSTGKVNGRFGNFAIFSRMVRSWDCARPGGLCIPFPCHGRSYVHVARGSLRSRPFPSPPLRASVLALCFMNGNARHLPGAPMYVIRLGVQNNAKRGT